MISNKPKVTAVNVEELFTSTYNVPIYQRDYAWGPAQIGDTWADLLDFFEDEDPNYLFGQIIVSPSPEIPGMWDLVDGQQRLTTISLLLSVLRVRLRESETEESKTLLNRVEACLFDDTPANAKLLVAKDARKSYSAMLNMETLYQDRSVSGSNLVDNRNDLYTKVAESLSEITKTLDFVERLLTRVWLIKVEMSEDEEAIEFFERTNDRGLDLNSADLLKNLLFSEVSDRELYKKVSESWSKSAKTLRQIPIRRISSMEYLMKAMVSARLGKHTSNKSVFRAWRSVLKGNKPAVLDLIATLPAAAANLQSIGAGMQPQVNTPDGLRCLAGNNMVQQYLVLLAGSHLSAESYQELTRVVRARFLLSLLSRERNGEFEKGLTPWAKELLSLPVYATKEQIIASASVSLSNVKQLITAAESQIRHLNYSRGLAEQFRMKTLLAICSSEFDRLAGMTVQDVAIDTYLETRFDIEHVTPQSTLEKITWSPADDLEYVNEIGNLTLLDRSDNRSLGDSIPSAKASAYAKSEILLTRILCDFGQIGNLPSSLKVVLVENELADNGRLTYWGPAAAAKRTLLYQVLLTKFFETSLIASSEL